MTTRHPPKVLKLRRTRRRTAHTRRTLLPLQQVIVARELHAGKPMKVVAADWKISIKYAHKIFHEHLVYRIEWKDGKEPKVK